MDLHILGPLDLLVDGRKVRLGGLRQQLVLAVLGLEANRVVPVSRLVDAVWEEAPPATAKEQIQMCVSSLRRALTRRGAVGVIGTQSPGYVLHAAAGQVDVQVFDERVASAHTLAEQGTLDEAAAALHAALKLWRGPALAGLPGRVVRAAAMQLDERRLAVFEQRVRVDLELGRHDELVPELLAVTEEYPMQERLWMHLMVALNRCGRRAEALEAYRRVRATFVDELGLEPGDELRRLEHAILVGSQDLDPRPYSVSAVRDPPVLPHQLPASVADFTGRPELVQEILDTLDPARSDGEPDGLRVVAIAGPAGVGKSTLAVHVAHRLHDEYPDGQLFANLSGAGSRPADPARILVRLLRALDVVGPALPARLDERAEMYRSRLDGRRVLVVLDDAASESQVLPLLPGSSTCAVIVTSRTPLTGLAGTCQIDVQVLDPRHAAELVAKIIGDARVEAEPEAVAELVELCGGLPLALRIAAARLAARPHWSVAHIVTRLRDEHGRLDELQHGDLGIRASISLSYEAIPDRARCLLRRLAVLTTPDFENWLGAAVLDTDLGDTEALFDVLVDARLLEASRCPSDGGVRFRFHDLVRLFALERATVEETPAERDAALQRAIGALLSLAELAHRHEYGGDYTLLHSTAPRWHVDPAVADYLLRAPMDWLDRERATLVALVRQAANGGLDELCWDLAMTSVTLFEARGYLDDWRETAESALAATREAGNRRGTAAMLHSLGALHIVEQRLDAASALCKLALEIFDECGDRHGRGLVLRNVAFIDRMRLSPHRATTRYLAALQVLREVGDRIGEAQVLNNLAALQLDGGDPDAAQKGLDVALHLCREVGSRRVEAQVLHRLGEVHLVCGELDRAHDAFSWVLRITRDRADRVGETYALLGLGQVSQRQGRHQQAVASLEQALGIACELGERLAEGRARYALGGIERARGRTDSAVALLVGAAELFRSASAVMWQARALVELSEAYTLINDRASARRSASEAGAMLAGVCSAEGDELSARLASLAPGTAGIGGRGRPA